MKVTVGLPWRQRKAKNPPPSPVIGSTHFRPPSLFSCGVSGDQQRWLWVMEPTRGRIFGKAFVLTRKFLLDATPAQIEDLKRTHYETMLMRERAGNTVPEGSDWEAFL